MIVAGRSVSLRSRIMLLVVGGAIVPLAAIGAWLSASTARSGRALLRAELDSALARIAFGMEDRWVHRAAELGLVANNQAAVHIVGAGTMDPADTRYLTDLAQELRASISEITYRDNGGRARWSSGEALSGVPIDGPSARPDFAGVNSLEAIELRRSVVGPDGRPAGSVDVRVLLSAVLPADSVQLIVAGGALRIRNRESGQVVGSTGPAADATSMVSAHMALQDPPLDLELAASDARYVRPFANAARRGLAALSVVIVLALVLTWVVTRRMTMSLEQMVDAAGAVAAGDLERVVTGRGQDEIGRLAAAFNAMTDSLRQTLRELSRRESLAAVGQFAATMSHEVRNALTAVRLDLQRLDERLPRGDAKQDAVTRALRNVRRLDTIVTGALRVARSDPETMRPLMVEGVVRAAVTGAEPVALEHGVTMVVETSEAGQARVRGDASALEQMFVNLLMNGAQAMPAGGAIRVRILADNGCIAVRITDEGTGITPERLARLGEPFFSSRPSGTGLGFPIARQIAQTHGGDVVVASTGSDGTVVEVRLPGETPPRPQPTQS